MGRQRKLSPGLAYRKGSQYIWTKKTIKGTGIQLRESTGETDPGLAELYLEKRIAEVRRQIVYGIRPRYKFSEGAARYIKTARDEKYAIYHCDLLIPYVGDKYMDEMHQEDFEPFIQDRLAQGRKKNTIKRTLEVARRIFNLAATTWRCDGNKRLTWIVQAPKIEMPTVDDEEPSEALTWEDQPKLLALLGAYADLALFGLNTGAREQEICGLRKEWSKRIEGVDRPVFVIPAMDHKTGKRSGKDKVLILNDVAWRIVEAHWNDHEDYVFVNPETGNRWYNINNTTWQKAIKEVGLHGRVSVHGLRATFDARLRDAGVGPWDISDLMGHTVKGMSHDYSMAARLQPNRINRLIQEANKVARPSLYVVRSGTLLGTVVAETA